MTDTQKQPNESREIELIVSGMTCQGCEQALEMALKQHEAVESARADSSSGKVRVAVNGEVDRAELRERIYAAGYDVQ